MESRLRWLLKARGRKAKATPTASPGLNSFAHLGEVRKIHGFESAFVKGKGNMTTP